MTSGNFSRKRNLVGSVTAFDMLFSIMFNYYLLPNTDSKQCQSTTKTFIFKKGYFW